jgi:hypothetical protein
MQPEVHRKATPPGDDSFQGLLHEDVQQVSNSELDHGNAARHSVATLPVQFLDNASDHPPAAVTTTACRSCTGCMTRPRPARSVTAWRRDGPRGGQILKAGLCSAWMNTEMSRCADPKISKVTTGRTNAHQSVFVLEAAETRALSFR